MRLSLGETSASSPLLVEFIGTPGCGKTRLAVEVAALLRRSGYRTAGSPELEQIVAARLIGPNKFSTSVRWAGYLVLHPRWARVTAPWMISRDGTRVAERTVRVTHRVRALTRTADAAVDVWIPDEWILHEIALAMAGGTGKGYARGLALFDAALDRLPDRMLVVHCEVDPMTAARRVTDRRSASDFDGQPVLKLLPRLKELAEIATMLHERAALAGRAAIAVRTDEPDIGASRSVENAILDLLNPAGGSDVKTKPARPRVGGAA